jgi:hypothetical protein
MEAVAMDKLVEKGDLTPQVALAVAEALDITIKAANLATVPMLDARFAQQDAKMEARFAQLEARFVQQDAKMEARFGSIEKSIESTKVWAALLYAGLAVVFFGALAADHRWEEVRTDGLIAEDRAHTDRLIAEDRAHTDQLIAEDRAHTDQLIVEQQANAKQAEARMDAKLDQLRAPLTNGSMKPGRTTRISPSP